MSAEGTPRQKMIGMMYLVLTALLALNVSKEIINAFVVITNGVENSNAIYSLKNESLMKTFKDQSKTDTKYEKSYQHALEVQEKSQKLYNYIKDLKIYLMASTENVDTITAIKEGKLTLNEVTKLDDYDISTNILVGSERDSPKAGKFSANELKLKLDEYKKYVFDLAQKDTILDKIHIPINTGKIPSIDTKGDSLSWEAGQFYHTPVSASIALLSKLQSDVKSTESGVIQALFDKVTGGTFKVSGWTPVVIADNVILQGSTSKAKIFLGAVDASQVPQVYIGSSASPLGDIDNGAAMYTLPSGSIGPQKFKGTIKIKDPFGNDKEYEFEREYSVSPPSVTVAATAMNVMYVGVANPISISVPGVPSDKVQVIFENCTKKTDKGKGNYEVDVKSPGQKAKIVVTAEINGEKKRMGEQEFRIKAVPDPVPAMGKKKGSFLISKSELMAQSGIQAELENFAFDLKFEVISFDISAKVGEFIVTKSANGNKFSEEMKQVFGKLSNKSKVYIENVKAKGPDGSVRILGAMSLTISGN